jgi:taurine dioxygenase
VKRDLTHYRHIAVAPVTGAIGAEITGIDASAALSDAVADELRRAIGEFHVIFLRDQAMDDEALLRLASVFARPSLAPLANRPGQPLISRMIREAEVPADQRNNGDRWHMDRAGDDAPPFGFLLYCDEAPEYGGDTLFASLSAAYDALTPEVQERLSKLTGIHSMSGVFGLDERTRRMEKPLLNEVRPLPFTDQAEIDFVCHEAKHPLVCHHPANGRPYLFVTGNYFLRIEGMEQPEAEALIDALNVHVTRPDFTCRFRWRPGSIAVLDNRCTLHFAAGDYAGFARRMRRVELGSDWIPQ